MGFFIGVIIFAVMIGFAVWAGKAFYNGKAVKGAITAAMAILSLIAFIVVPFSFHTVESGEVAVVKQFGKAKEVKTAGLTYEFWATHKFIHLDTKVQDLPIETITYSSDAQTMEVSMNVQYQIKPDDAIKIVETYGTLDNLSNKISSIITEQVKAVLSAHTAMHIIANRAAMTPAVEKTIRTAVGDEYFVDIVVVAITNIDFSDAFERAVEDKMIAEQAKLKAEYENEKKVAQAKAEADAEIKAAEAKIEIAKAEAEAKKIEAEAEAEANELKEKSLTDKILQEKYLEKWDGKLPDVVAGDAPTSIMIPTEESGE